MEIFDSVDELEQQVESIRAKLEALEEDVSRDQAMLRLRRAYPWHPVLLARQLFIFMTGLGGLAAIGVGVLPFAQPQFSRDLATFQDKVGMPLPLVLGLLAVCMWVAWMMSTQAAISIGRECPLAPWEKKERDRLASELSRLTRQRQMMERVRGTPMGARPRLLTPVPTARGRSSSGAGVRARSGSPTPSGAPSYAAPPGGGLLTPTPEAAVRRASQNLSLPSRTPTPANATPRTLGQATRGAADRRRTPTPLGAVPRRGTPVGGPREARPRTPTPGMAGRTAAPEPLVDGVLSTYDTPTDQYSDDFLADASTHGGFVIDESAHSAPRSETLPPYAEPTTQPPSGEGFTRSLATQIPMWGDLGDEWLIDTVEKAQILAESFPIQARLEFNLASGLPFGLVLERATPAMAVRAMMAFVEFLASIATPPRARVELHSVAHLDRSFHRNIKAALDPYFPGTAEVVKQGDAVDIVFHESDDRWKSYPYIPTTE